jgi:hypothetical protein
MKMTAMAMPGVRAKRERAKREIQGGENEERDRKRRKAWWRKKEKRERNSRLTNDSQDGTNEHEGGHGALLGRGEGRVVLRVQVHAVAHLVTDVLGSAGAEEG